MYDEAPYRPTLRLDLDEFIPGLRRVADAVHQEGTPIIAEVMAGFGRMGKPAPGRDTIAASPLNVVMTPDRMPPGILMPAPRVLPVPREATLEEIRSVEQDTAAAALRVREAGFDGAEVAAHMSYFLSSFLAPRTNWRSDEYGGSPENRARVLVNIVRDIRAQAGPDFPIGLRMSVNEHVDGGQGPADYAEIARLVELAGADYVALCDGNYEAMEVNAPSTDGEMIRHGEPQAFKAALGIPVLLGNLHDPTNAAQAIADGHGDAVMFARQMLADPDYANKVREGRVGEIVRCDHSNYCLRRLLFNFPVRCHVNPEMGREARSGTKVPPLERVLKAPLEQTVLALTGSPVVMGAAGRMAARKTGARAA
jgi:2,4-dienoyl-CoA reductase (NADPH2)